MNTRIYYLTDVIAGTRRDGVMVVKGRLADAINTFTRQYPYYIIAATERTNEEA